MNALIRPIWMLTLAAVAAATFAPAVRAEDDDDDDNDRGRKVVIIKESHGRGHDKWRPRGPVRGALQPAAYELYRASGELLDVVRDEYRAERRYEDEALAALERLNERAANFYEDSNDERVYELRNEFDTLRRAWDRAEDYFRFLPRDRYVANLTAQTEVAYRNLSRTYLGMLNARPVGRPVPGPSAGQFELARQIEFAARDLEGEALELYRAGYVRGDGREVRRVLDRLNEVVDRARDLRIAVERRDNVRHNLAELRDAYEDASQRYGVFGNRLNAEYARLGALIRRFDFGPRHDDYEVVRWRR